MDFAGKGLTLSGAFVKKREIDFQKVFLSLREFRRERNRFSLLRVRKGEQLC